MEFKRFPDIENSYNAKFITELHGRDEYQWIVEEKVDGTNFSFYCDGNEVKYGKRTSFITEEDKFFNCLNVVPKYNQQMLKLFDLVKNKYESELIEKTNSLVHKIVQQNEITHKFHHIICFGEYYGGLYKIDGKLQSAGKKINNNVLYRPDNDFIAYDLLICTLNAKGKIEYEFVPHKQFIDMIKQTTIPYVKPFFTGTFEEALKFNQIFITPIPQELGLQPIEDNFAEGVVIRPDRPIILNNGGRFILKKKNPTFSERKPNIIHSESNNYDIELLSKLDQFVTMSRLHNVISKIGEVGMKDISKIITSFNADVIKDYEKEYEPINPEKLKTIKKQYNSAMMRIILKYFENQ